MTLGLRICFVFTKNIILSLFKIDTLKLHHVYFNDFDMPFNNVITLHNLTSMKIFFTIDHKRS